MKSKSDKIALWLLKDLNKAIYQYNMIEDGDRVAVAVSGGKDSLSLLKLLDFRRTKAKENYEIIAIHINGDTQGPKLVPHPPLLNWLEKKGYSTISEYFKIPDTEETPLNCHRCSWNRKKQIFEIAHKMNCNVVAFAHNADDFAQTTLLNLVFHGRAETIQPVNVYFEGVFRVIRPLCYIAEKEIIKYSKASNFPEPPPECIRSKHSQRHFVGEFLKNTNRHFPYVRKNLVRAGLRGNLGKYEDKIAS